jgi:hypothetical protein
VDENRALREASFAVWNCFERYEPEGWRDPKGERKSKKGSGLPGENRETGFGH